MAATITKTKSAVQFCGSAIVRVYQGGRKKKLKEKAATIDVRRAVPRSKMVAMRRTIRRNMSAVVVGLICSRKGIRRNVAAPIAATQTR